MNKYSIFIGISSIIIIVAAVFASHSISSRPTFQTVAAAPGNVTQGVSANGEVQAAQDLKLSFQSAGTITAIPVNVGDKVKAGDVLARLDGKGAKAALDQASATLAAANANYQKVLNGATNVQVLNSQTALANATSSYASAKAQQDTLVNNAYATMLSGSLTAVAGPGNLDTIIPTVTGTYSGTTQGQYSVSISTTGGGWKFQYSGLETGSGNVQNIPTPLGTKGLYIQFAATPSTNDTWTVSIPNTASPSYQANYNAYQSALQTRDVTLAAAQNAINSAQVALQMVQTPARPEDVAAAQAQVATAQAAVEAAQNNYNNTTITAPIDGTVSEVDAKIGQSASPGVPEIGLISNQQFQTVVNVSENDLNKIKVGDNAQVTLSAYGDGATFPATIVDISPDTSMTTSAPGYKVTLNFNNTDDRIKSGMAAHVTISDLTHNNVLAVPASSLLDDNNNYFVLTQSGKTVKRVPVQIGLRGVDNTVEITGGLNNGEQVVYFGK